MAMGRAHTAEGPFKRYTTSAGLEPPGEEKARAPKTNMEAQLDTRAEDSGHDLGGSQVDRHGPQKVEDDGRGPMLPEE